MMICPPKDKANQYIPITWSGPRILIDYIMNCVSCTTASRKQSNSEFGWQHAQAAHNEAPGTTKRKWHAPTACNAPPQAQSSPNIVRRRIVGFDPRNLNGQSASQPVLACASHFRVVPSQAQTSSVFPRGGSVVCLASLDSCICLDPPLAAADFVLRSARFA